MSIPQDKKRILITLPKEKIREFKVKAAQADLSLSEFISKAGSVSLEQILTQKPMNSLVNQGYQNMQPNSQIVTPKQDDKSK